MKRMRFHFLLVFGLLFSFLWFSASVFAQHEWNIETVDGAKSIDVWGPRYMALDQYGHPHLAYGGNHLYYAYYDGSNWYIETVDSEGDFDGYTSLALDSSGNPHISYHDATNEDLKYAYYDGSNWHIETVDSEGSVGYFSSLALDSSGNPHISYYYYYYDSDTYDIIGALRYAYYDGSSWHIETVDDAGLVGHYPSLALDSSGNPHISYYDATNEDLKYAYYDGSSWHIETVDSEGNVGRYTSLALDSSGNPHISYQCHEYDSDYPDSLKYAYYDGTKWNIETVEKDIDVGQYTSLALDSSGNPHISYYNSYHVEDLRYAYKDGNGWHKRTLDYGGEYSSLALDSSGNPHISHYHKYSSEAGLMRYTYYDGSGWHTEEVDREETVGEYSSLALDSSGNPHISYYDYYNSDLKYAYYDGSNWHIETVDSTWNAGYTSLALDSSGNPHISYLGSSGLKYAYYDGSNWQIETVDSTWNAGYTSLALDSSGNPHISYFAYYNSDLKYAYYDGSNWHIETVDSEGDVGLYTSLALDSSGNPHISYYDATNEDLKYAYYDGNNWHIETVDTGSWYGVGEYTSLALDSSGNPHISYYDRCNLDYAYYDGSSWHTETVDTGGSDCVGKYTSLALDSSNRPYISYFDDTDYALKFSYYNGSYWHTETVDRAGGEYTSLALDSSGNPHISYHSSFYHNLKYTFSILNTLLTIGNPKNGGVFVPEEGGQISCYYWGGDCSEVYEKGTEVTLYAVPDEGFEFDGWSGDCSDCGFKNFCTIIMENDKKCYASFSGGGNQDGDNQGGGNSGGGNQGGGAFVNLTITPVPQNGSIFVPEEGGQISCGSGSTDCSESYEESTDVTLYAVPDEGYEFTGWTGDCAECESESCTITMDSDKTCSAIFESIEYEPPVIDSFTAEPTSGDAPLTVNFTCQAHDPDGGIIESIEWFFDSGDWPDDLTINNNFTITHTYDTPGVYVAHCRVWDDENQNATSGNITITVNAPTVNYRLDVSVNPEDGGTVTGSGITCPSDCNETYEEGTDVTLSATPSEGYRFSSWSGDCAECDGTTCTVTMNRDKTCTANFEPIPNEPPEIDSFTAEPTSGDAPLTVTFTCEAHDNDGSVVEYCFDFDGDGENDQCDDSTNTATFTYNEPGTYQPTCTVTDNDGQSVTSEAQEQEITVNEAAPSWLDITDTLDITHSARQLYDRIHRCFFIQVTVENPGEEAISGPVRLVITDPSIPVKTGVGVGLEPDGYTDDGDPYFIIVPEEESLDAGEVLRNLRINFELQRKRLTYGIRIEQLGQ